MSRIAPAILRADVHNERVRLLTLYRQGSDQGILGVHNEVIYFALHLHALTSCHMRTRTIHRDSLG